MWRRDGTRAAGGSPVPAGPPAAGHGGLHARVRDVAPPAVRRGLHQPELQVLQQLRGQSRARLAARRPRPGSLPPPVPPGRRRGRGHRLRLGLRAAVQVPGGPARLVIAASRARAAGQPAALLLHRLPLLVALHQLVASLPAMINKFSNSPNVMNTRVRSIKCALKLRTFIVLHDCQKPFKPPFSPSITNGQKGIKLAEKGCNKVVPSTSTKPHQTNWHLDLKKSTVKAWTS